MSNDNTLGAPTEGLGQTVTFTAPSQGGTQEARAYQRGALRLNSTGGGATDIVRGQHIPTPPRNDTFDVLIKLGSAIMAPHVERAKAEAYMSGVQQAAQGRAIDEIAAEQPWYNKLFGDTSLVDGARAYSAAARSTAAVGQLENDMGELRKLDGPEFSSHVANLLTSKTGDPASDLLYQQQLSQALPGVMKGQAKANFRYKQENLEKGIEDSVTAALARVQATTSRLSDVGDGLTEVNDWTAVQADLARTLERPANIDPAHFDKIVIGSYVKSITNGNFAAYDNLALTGKLKQLPVDLLNAVERAKGVATADARAKLPYEFHTQVAAFRNLSGRGASEQEIIEAAQAIDMEYFSLTGDMTPYIGGANVTQELSQANAAAIRAQGKVDEAQAKTDYTMKLHAYVTGPNRGYMGDEKPRQQQEVYDLARALDLKNGTKSLYNLLASTNQHNALDEHTKNSIEGNAGAALAAGDPAGLYKTYVSYYAPLVAASGDNYEVIADRYAGDHREMLARYHALAKGNPNPDAAQIGAMYTEATRPLPKHTATDKDQKAIVASLNTGVFMRGIHSIFAPDEYPVEDTDGLARILGPKMNRGLGTDEAVKAARLRSEELSVVAGYHWVRGTKDKKLEPWLLQQNQVGSDNVNRATRYTIDKVAKLAGIDGKLTVNQTVDTADGIPRLYVTGSGSDGNVKIRTFTAQEIQDNWAAKKQDDSSPKPGTPLGNPIEPKLVNSPWQGATTIGNYRP